MRRRAPIFLLVLVLILGLLAGCGGGAPTTGQNQTQKVTLRVSSHWGDEFKEQLQPLLDAYEKETGVHIDWQAVPFNDFFQKVQVESLSGDPPDLWHLYSLWGPQLATSGALAEAPETLQQLVKNEFPAAAQGGVTFGGKIYGTPTEINNYLLLYNKRLLAEAGINKAPETWDELYQAAKAVTKHNSDGTIETAGMAFMKGWDSAVVHPFLTLVYSNGGEYISADGTQLGLNSPAAQAALELQVKLIQEKLADPGLDYTKLFPAGKIAMVISAPFVRGSFSTAMGESWKDVGVAPVPHGPNGQSRSISYTWFWGVAKDSKNQEQAWKFVQWLNQPVQGEQVSRMGKFLGHYGIIPSKSSDFELYKDDPFMKPFVDQLPNTVAEPNLTTGQEMKTKLMGEIEAAWYGKKSPSDALKSANDQLITLLQQAK